MHRGARVTFSGRTFERIPEVKFKHCMSKFFPGRKPWEEPEKTPVAVAETHAESNVECFPATDPRRFDDGLAMREERGEAAPPSEMAPVVEEQHMGAPPEEAAAQQADQGAEEDKMSSSSGNRAVRFICDTHGKKLLAAVRSYIAESGDTMGQRGFWENFATWAEGVPALAEWKAKGASWYARWYDAKYFFSRAAAKHLEQTQRIEALRKKHKMTDPDIWNLIGGPKCAAGKQFRGQRPWAEGALERLAAFFEVSVEYLRDGTVPTPVAPATPTPPVAPVNKEEVKRIAVLNDIGNEVVKRSAAEVAKEIKSFTNVKEFIQKIIAWQVKLKMQIYRVDPFNPAVERYVSTLENIDPSLLLENGLEATVKAWCGGGRYRVKLQAEGVKDLDVIVFVAGEPMLPLPEREVLSAASPSLHNRTDDQVELDRLRKLLNHLAQNAEAGRGIGNDQLRFLVSIARGDDPFELLSAMKFVS